MILIYASALRADIPNVNGHVYTPKALEDIVNIVRTRRDEGNPVPLVLTYDHVVDGRVSLSNVHGFVQRAGQIAGSCWFEVRFHRETQAPNPQEWDVAGLYLLPDGVSVENITHMNDVIAFTFRRKGSPE